MSKHRIPYVGALNGSTVSLQKCDKLIQKQLFRNQQINNFHSFYQKELNSTLKHTLSLWFPRIDNNFNIIHFRTESWIEAFQKKCEKWEYIGNKSILRFEVLTIKKLNISWNIWRNEQENKTIQKTIYEYLL